ncbi:hypothetical protein PoB_000576900 [Plakobranchus ocellatus]|uniref:Uncharacterized protein n=1 Tax=Plakobranchus ocellatus TaxID=259542 RepID=A0AAV3YAF0_9GAST|nr:hypothetical protein PoB_000576900 [Plakobranchus ocellatus]
MQVDSVKPGSVVQVDSLKPGSSAESFLLRIVVSQAVPHDVTQLLEFTNGYRSTVASTHQPRHVSNMNRLVWSERLAAQARETVTCRSNRRGRRQMLEALFPSMNVGRKRNRQSAFFNIVRDWYSQRLSFECMSDSARLFCRPAPIVVGVYLTRDTAGIMRLGFSSVGDAWLG